MNYTILQGDNRETLKTIADNSIDAIITDPPYGIDFLGKDWDANTGALETYQECLRVLKPGGHILAFSAARTYHHLAITLEQAGFEIRDQIMWIYSSGFPKSQDVGKSIERSKNKQKNKATKNKLANNNKIYFPDPENVPVESAGQLTAPRCVLCHSSTGPIHKKCSREDCIKPWHKEPADNEWAGWGTALKPAHEPIALARKPMKLSIAKNAQKWGTGALNIDATRVHSTDLKPGTMGKAPPNLNAIGTPSTIETSDEPWIPNEAGRFPSNVIGEIPDYQKYFYCPKVSRRERHIGYELPPPMFGDVKGCYDENGERFAVGFDNRSESKTKKKKHDPLGHLNLPDFSRKKDADGKPVKSDSSWMYDPKGVDKIQDATSKNTNVGNNHPTVKPVELMKYLIKLITPPGGTVLDPFNGSGSTGMAAVELGHPYIGCELDPRYVEIAKTRIEAWYKETYDTSKELFE